MYEQGMGSISPRVRREWGGMSNGDGALFFIELLMRGASEKKRKKEKGARLPWRLLPLALARLSHRHPIA